MRSQIFRVYLSVNLKSIFSSFQPMSRIIYYYDSNNKSFLAPYHQCLNFVQEE